MKQITANSSKPRQPGGLDVDFPSYYMSLAFAVSMRAKCAGRKVGSVVVSADNRIIATGYNGAPDGLPNCRVPDSLYGSIRQVKDAFPGPISDSGSCLGDWLDRMASLYVSSMLCDQVFCARCFDRAFFDIVGEYYAESGGALVPALRRRLEGGTLQFRPDDDHSGGDAHPLIPSQGVSQSSKRDLDLCVCVHAEENAIVSAGKNGVSLRGSTVYVTDMPCMQCAKSLLQAGVVSVCYARHFEIDPSKGVRAYVTSATHRTLLEKVGAVKFSDYAGCLEIVHGLSHVLNGLQDGESRHRTAGDDWGDSLRNSLG